MPRLRHFLLLVAMLSAALAAHADTVTTDHVAFSYTTIGSSFAPSTTYQYNFSFMDGIVVNSLNLKDYSFGVTVYPGTGTLGSPSSGIFDIFPDGGTTQFNFGQGYVYGNVASPFQSTSRISYVSTALFFKPGTYTLINPLLQQPVSGFRPAASASFTITQTTTRASGSVSVTPEPSSFALLGTGLLGLGGVLRRHGRAHA